MATEPDIANLIAWLSLDEESGNRADSHGAYVATDVNSVLYAAGKVGNAADFELDNSEYFTVTLDSVLKELHANDFSVSFWCNIETLSGIASTYRGVLYTKGTWATGGIDIKAAYNEQMAFIHNGGQNQATTIHGNPFGTGTYIGVWNHVVCTHDATAKVLRVYVNSSLRATSSAYAYTNYTSDATNGYVGSIGAGSHVMDGLIDELSIWGSVLDADNVAWLYNSGSGVAYSDLTQPSSGYVSSGYGKLRKPVYVVDSPQKIMGGHPISVDIVDEADIDGKLIEGGPAEPIYVTSSSKVSGGKPEPVAITSTRKKVGGVAKKVSVS